MKFRKMYGGGVSITFQVYKPAQAAAEQWFFESMVSNVSASKKLILQPLLFWKGRVLCVCHVLEFASNSSQFQHLSEVFG
jgi:hypothetical protein